MPPGPQSLGITQDRFDLRAAEPDILEHAVVKRAELTDRRPALPPSRMEAPRVPCGNLDRRSGRPDELPPACDQLMQQAQDTAEQIAHRLRPGLTCAALEMVPLLRGRPGLPHGPSALSSFPVL
jgi:hypothetical protein